jgi:TolA-binding protein
LGRPDFVVQAGEVLVRVVGTRFEVGRSDAGAVVSVTEGIVLVENAGRRVRLGPGDRWSEAEPEPTGETRARSSKRVTRSLEHRRKDSPTAGELFDRAASLEASDPTGALDLYERVSRAGGRWAASASFARARLLVEQGQSAEAQRLLERYVRRYPRGTNVADARRLLSVLRSRQTDD